MGGVNFSGLTATAGEAVFTYGVFIQSIIDFLIVALVIFMVVKGINKAKQAIEGEEEVTETKQAEPSEEVKLLREIRDTLKG